MKKLIQLSIPNPCNEDWNKMTRNEKGAFCSLCQKDVVDFSKMSNEAIQHYFLNNQDKKTCGRLSKKQLDEPLLITVNKNDWRNISSSPLKLFAASLLLVFGTSLFSCTTQNGADIGKIKFEISADSLEINSSTEASENKEMMLVGDTSFDDTIIFETLGEVAITEEPLPLQKTINSKADSVIEIKEFASSYCDIKGEVMIAGGISFDMIETEEDSINLDSVPKEMINTERISDEKTDKPFEKRSLKCIIYPNPVKDNLQLRIDITEANQYHLYLLSIDGKKVKKNITEWMEPGEHRKYIDVSHLPEGLYFYVIESKNQSLSNKFLIAR